MKTTVVITLAAATLAVAGCTTSDPTPPGSLGALAEAEESDEEEGIPNEAEREAEGAAGEGGGTEGAETEGNEGAEAEGGESEAEQTEAPTGGSEEGDAAQGQGTSEGDAVGENVRPPTGADLPDPSEMTDETCIAFFDGAAPLAGRAQDARFLVSRGAVNNLTSVEFAEIDALAQRLDELGSTGTEEQTALIELINAPFTGVQRVVSDEGGQDAESGEVSYDSIATGEAEQAQEELTQGCLSSESDS